MRNRYAVTNRNRYAVTSRNACRNDVTPLARSRAGAARPVLSKTTPPPVVKGRRARQPLWKTGLGGGIFNG